MRNFARIIDDFILWKCKY